MSGIPKAPDVGLAMRWILIALAPAALGLFGVLAFAVYKAMSA